MSSSALSSSSTSMKIGFVGFGRFAQFLAKTFVRQGHTLHATSRSDYSTLCSQLGIQFYREVTTFLDADNDVVLISTSILSLPEVLRSMPLDRLKKPVLFVDVLSVKEFPREVLLQVLPEESDILCTHPMFGPVSGNDGWRDLNFMYEKVRIRNEDICSNFLKIFESEGCRMLEMTCEEHDRLAAKSQFITHAIGRALGEMEITSTPIDTKGFQTLVQVKDTVMSSSLDLFSGLFMHNRFARQELDNLENALHKVKEMLIQKTNEEQEKTEC
ncbi:arogenate dehydrogenase 1, chloroplastic-like [Neltuma alba]|uniref:arogenate dehydrogenase 1, chloroplastic-like n=1 Tax=Neltuma alba TaxID=207710 RepID=UPI0010A446E6|nr:arogenate dehydrogenase 1, chloroplastic-like [Prosopis alba]